MKTIKLTKDKEAMVDDCDYNMLSAYRWYWALKPRSKFGYAVADLHNIDNEFGVRHVTMHRMLLKPDRGKVVDHVNGNGLDNRRENIRICTLSQNNANFAVGGKRNKSGYKGVSWHKSTQKWRATLLLGGKQHYLGIFDDKLEAARAYNVEALKCFGEFARINDI